MLMYSYKNSLLRKHLVELLFGWLVAVGILSCGPERRDYLDIGTDSAIGTETVDIELTPDIGLPYDAFSSEIPADDQTSDESSPDLAFDQHMADDYPDDTGPVPSLLEVCQAGAALLVDAVNRCASVGTSELSLWYDNFVLGGDLDAYCQYFVRYRQASIDGGRITIDEAALRRCVHAQYANCGEVIFGGILFIREFCSNAFIGAVEVGQECFLSDECVSGRYCHKISGKCPGTCKEYQEPEHFCYGDGDCERGYYCTTDWRCAKSVLLGGECTFFECDDGLTCFQGACMFAFESFSGECGVTVEGGIEACPTGTRCQTEIGALAGACKPLSQLGGDCSRTQECDWGLGCVESKCVVGTAIGDECDNTTLQCARGGFCFNGRCVGLFKAKDGDPCGLDWGCASGVADADHCVPFDEMGDSALCEW